MGRNSVRPFPWLLSLLGAALALAWTAGGLPIPDPSGRVGGEATAPSGPGVGNVQEWVALSALPTPGPVDCAGLYALSEQAAALTGSLALVEAGERPAQAREAAALVRGLAVQAAGLEGGGELAGVLEALADGLEGYAGACRERSVAGDPLALQAVMEASEANARLRAACDAACDTEKNTQNGGER